MKQSIISPDIDRAVFGIGGGSQSACIVVNEGPRLGGRSARHADARDVVHPVISVGGRERSARLIGGVGLDDGDQIAENVLRELLPVPGRIGDRGLVAGIGIGGGADAVGLDGLDGASEAVVGVDGHGEGRA